MSLEASIKHISGFQATGVAAGIKPNQALDLALITSETPCVAAGVFTTNLVKAAPVLQNQAALQTHSDRIRAVVINSGCANACTGQLGTENALRTANLVAAQLNCEPEQVLVMSTGVIGEQLPMDAMEYGIDLAAAALGDDWQSASQAIMTTDTRPKLASITVETDEGSYTIAGICKGSGMIAPNMATMLSVIVTDAVVPASATQTYVQDAVEQSFNRIVVDGDSSTNDTVLLLVNGASGVQVDSEQSSSVFQQALNTLSQYLAKEIVRDGEGVTKFITLNVHGAVDDKAAQDIGHTIATSALVKTAFYGNDANWGRIIAAAGRAGVPFDPNLATLCFSVGEDEDAPSTLLVFENGTAADYSEEEALVILREPNVTVWLDCGQGTGNTQIWTCDLSHEYVTINAEYRT